MIDRYLVQYGAIPRPVRLIVEIETSSLLTTKREIENATWKIAWHEIAARGGPAGFTDVTSLPPKGKRPQNTLSHPNFPGVYVWLVEELDSVHETHVDLLRFA